MKNLFLRFRQPLSLLLGASLLAALPPDAAFSEEADPTQTPEGRNIHEGESISVVVYKWAKARQPGVKTHLYGPGGLVEQTLRLNPWIEDPDFVFYEVFIRLPDLPWEHPTAPVPLAQEVPPSQQPAEPKGWRLHGSLGIGAQYRTFDETYSNVGIAQTSGNTFAKPVFAFSTYVDSEKHGWEFGLQGKAVGGSNDAGTPFPWSYDFELYALKRWRHLFLGPSFEYQQYKSTTPDIALYVQKSVLQVKVRETATTWALLNAGSRFQFLGMNWEGGGGFGKALNTSSDSGPGTAAFSDFSGYKGRAQLRADLFKIGSVPIQSTLIGEKVWLSPSQGSVNDMIFTFLVGATLF